MNPKLNDDEQVYAFMKQIDKFINKHYDMYMYKYEQRAITKVDGVHCHVLIKNSVNWPYSKV